MANIVYRFVDEKPQVKQPNGKRGPSKGRGGRFSKKSIVDLYMIETLYSFGLTDEQIAKALDISAVSLESWKKEENFLRSLRKGKAIADDRVVRALYERATGYMCPDTDIRVVNGELVKTEIIKHYPPDATSCLFWLKNRKKDEWRDKHEVGLSGQDGGPPVFKVVYENKVPAPEE